MFGVPDEGIHKYRLVNTPIVDYVGTIILSMMISYVTDISLVITTILMFVFSIILHYLFDVRTNSNI